MVELCPYAGDAFARDVWDSVGLWLYHEGNGELLAYLTARQAAVTSEEQMPIPFGWVTELADQVHTSA